MVVIPGQQLCKVDAVQDDVSFVRRLRVQISETDNCNEKGQVLPHSSGRELKRKDKEVSPIDIIILASESKTISDLVPN